MLRAIFTIAEADNVKVQMIVDFCTHRKQVTSYEQLVIDGKPFVDGDITALRFHGVTTNVDGCRFLEVVGHEFKKGELIDIDFT